MELMWDAETLTALRAALYARSGVVDLVRGRLTDDVLQMVGDGLVSAIADHQDGARDVAAECSAALRLRDWTGDDVLADQLEAALEMCPPPLLRPLAVDLEELGSMLEGDFVYGGGRIDLRTGDTWPEIVAGETFDEDADDPDRWLYVECTGSRAGYRDMELFIDSLTDTGLADRLTIAISGRGAFRRFREVLVQMPDEFHRYQLLSDERTRGRARRWLADQGYRTKFTQR
ncbi:UPF0158 family protein [Rhodococcus sp. NPDC019627]|uniref:UPF0158 family protein n=1 Tax=unclassified Rhodococcus (in: high G+C Gram-positive bacteria) TaxID=192944 RepID=UPI0033DD5B20